MAGLEGLAVFGIALAGLLLVVLLCFCCMTVCCGRFLGSVIAVAAVGSMASSSNKRRAQQQACAQGGHYQPQVQVHQPAANAYYVRTEVTPLVASAPTLTEYSASAPPPPGKLEPPMAVTTGAHTTMAYEVLHQHPPQEQTQVTMPHVPVPEGGQWRDTVALVFFIINLAGLVTLAFFYGLPFLGVAESKLDGYQYDFPHGKSASARTLLWLCLGLMVLADLLALFWMHVMLFYAGGLLEVILWTTVLVSGALAVASLMWTNLALFTFTLITLIAFYILYAEKRRVKICSANLRLACAAVRAEQSSLLMVTYLLFLVQMVHTAIWCMAAIGTFGKITASKSKDHHTANTALVTFLVLSLYWGSEVIKNVLRCTVNGAVGGWWYTPDMPNRVPAALYRACTSSLGSICLGSLCVALIEVVRWLFSAFARVKKIACCLAFIVDLALAWAEACFRQFNRWAYVYVAVFGYDFRGASIMALRLFSVKAMYFLINDYLISNVLLLGCLLVGAVTAALGVLLQESFPAAFESLEASKVFLTVAGFLLGYLCCAMVMGLVSSAVDTVIVCFVNDPEALQTNHPYEFQSVNDAWLELEAERRGTLHVRV